jgi:hypothetical protein
MNKLIQYLSLTIFALAFFASNCISQVIDAEVTVNMEQLPFESRTYVSSMADDVERYLDNERFTDFEWEGPPIPVSLTIYLEGGYNNRYSAKMFIISKRYLDGPDEVAGMSIVTKFFDQKWSFYYDRGASFSFNPLVFDEFRSLLDFYILTIIGFDLDTYAELGGTEMFTQAKNILSLGATNQADGYDTYSKPGEFTKYNLVSELTDLRYNEFRRLMFNYYYDGLDLIAFDREKGIANIKKTLNDMADFKEHRIVSASALIQTFFDAKSDELAGMFNGHQDDQLFKDLKYLDPSNSILYNEAKDGKIGK